MKTIITKSGSKVQANSVKEGKKNILSSKSFLLLKSDLKQVLYAVYLSIFDGKRIQKSNYFIFLITSCLIFSASSFSLDSCFSIDLILNPRMSFFWLNSFSISDLGAFNITWPIIL